MNRVREFTMTRVGWTSLVALGVVRAMEISRSREVNTETLLRDFLVNFTDVPTTALPRLIREVLHILPQAQALQA